MKDKTNSPLLLRCATLMSAVVRRTRACAFLFVMAGMPLHALAQQTVIAPGSAGSDISAATSTVTSTSTNTSPGTAADATLLRGLVRERIGLPISLPDGAKPTLEALVIRPDRPGRWPLVLMTPGTPRNHGNGVADRAPELLLTAAVAFAQRGYASVIVLRRGFGRSDGPYAEGLGSCRNEDYPGAGKASADDLLGALESLRAQPWVDGDHVILLGKSTGGFATLAAAARNPQGVVGVLDFAGGRGSSRPDYVCEANLLISTVGQYGETTKVPSLWVWSENDHFFSPELAHEMLSAYTSHGAPAQLAVLPPFRDDGHELLYDGPEEAWWPTVEPFLKGLGLPTAVLVHLPAPAAIAVPAGLNQGCQDLFEGYGAYRNEGKAFVIAEGGHCMRSLTERSTQDAAQQALERCNAKWSGCKVYAQGQHVSE